MYLNIVSNIKSCYYNYMVVFYLCLNCVLPFYDDVIISMQSHSLKLLIGENDLDMKCIKRKRMIDLINDLHDDDKLFLEKESNLLIVEYSHVADVAAVDAESSSASSGEDMCNEIQTETNGAQETRKRQREDDICESNTDFINKNKDD